MLFGIVYNSAWKTDMASMKGYIAVAGRLTISSSLPDTGAAWVKLNRKFANELE